MSVMMTIDKKFKMKIMQKLLYLFFFSLFIFSCTKDTSSEPELNNPGLDSSENDYALDSELFGRWQIVSVDHRHVFPMSGNDYYYNYYSIKQYEFKNNGLLVYEEYGYSELDPLNIVTTYSWQASWKTKKSILFYTISNDSKYQDNCGKMYILTYTIKKADDTKEITFQSWPGNRSYSYTYAE